MGGERAERGRGGEPILRGVGGASECGLAYVLDEPVARRVAEAVRRQNGVEAALVLNLEDVEPVAGPPLGVAAAEERLRVVERPVDQLDLVGRRRLVPAEAGVGCVRRDTVRWRGVCVRGAVRGVRREVRG